MADSYTIVDQAQADELGPAGLVVPSMRITFETKPHGVRARVSIPISAYTADEVRRIVDKQAAEIEAVAGL